jgi:hypothetical protein
VILSTYEDMLGMMIIPEKRFLARVPAASDAVKNDGTFLS